MTSVFFYYFLSWCILQLLIHQSEEFVVAEFVVAGSADSVVPDFVAVEMVVVAVVVAGSEPAVAGQKIKVYLEEAGAQRPEKPNLVQEYLQNFPETMVVDDNTQYSDTGHYYR